MAGRRIYGDVSQFRAPFNMAQVSGLGGPSYSVDGWPKGRRYYSTANFRAPYDTGYFGDGSLGSMPGAEIVARAPIAFKNYVDQGIPMPTLGRDLAAASAQIPQWVWLASAAAAAAGSYYTYKAFKKKHPSSAK